MKVIIKIPNTLENQEISRSIRNLNQFHQCDISVFFSEDLQTILLEGKTILIPDASILDRHDIEHTGQLKPGEPVYKLIPLAKGKTVNLYLDAALVKELEEIRNHVSDKTQHDLLLDIFKQGIKQYKDQLK